MISWFIMISENNKKKFCISSCTKIVEEWWTDEIPTYMTTTAYQKAQKPLDQENCTDCQLWSPLTRGKSQKKGMQISTKRELNAKWTSTKVLQGWWYIFVLLESCPAVIQELHELRELFKNSQQIKWSQNEWMKITWCKSYLKKL